MKKSIIPAAILSATLMFPAAAFAIESPTIRYLGQSDGYDSVIDWYNDLQSKKDEAVGIAGEAIDSYSSIITDEEKETLYSLEKRMTTAVTMDIYNEAYEQTNDLMDALDSRIPKLSYSSYSGGYYGPEGVLTKAAGVNSFAGRRETWYSSNILYHYRTPEWTPDANGVYRDSEGYVVVAASDLAQGSVVETSHGTGKVYDSGCASGTTDIYTNW